MKLRHHDEKEAALKIWRRNVSNRGSNRFQSPRQERLGGFKDHRRTCPYILDAGGKVGNMRLMRGAAVTTAQGCSGLRKEFGLDCRCHGKSWRILRRVDMIWVR